MPLHPGTTLGPYRVTAKIGEGGMGEVYQARDTKLDRDVALKVLPEAFTSDPDRLARFEREAKVLASLNHTNIGNILGASGVASNISIVGCDGHAGGPDTRDDGRVPPGVRPLEPAHLSARPARAVSRAMMPVEHEPSAAPRFSKSARGRLTDKDLGRFPTDTLFDRIGRAVCGAGCLPRRELYEAWEMARRVRRRFRGGRVVDLAGGHGLLAQILLLLDDTSPSAVVVDPVVPASAPRVQTALREVWHRLDGRVAFISGDLHATAIGPTDLVVSCHACGVLTDLVIDRAVAAGARVAVLPCCHDLGGGAAKPLRGWVDGPLAIDIGRAMRLGKAGYQVWTQTIPAEITEKNRLLIAAPKPGA